jgi:hypothetical protein
MANARGVEGNSYTAGLLADNVAHAEPAHEDSVSEAQRKERAERHLVEPW